IAVLTDTPEDARGGVLCDGRGEVRAFFASFDFQSARREHCSEETTEAFGIPANVFLPMLEAVKKSPDSTPEVRSLDVEITAVDLATLARGAGKLPQKWMQAVLQRCGQQGQVPRAICVNRVLATGASTGRLRPGDVLLSVAGKTIACALDVEEALLPPKKGAKAAPPEVVIRVLRDQREVLEYVTPSILGSEDRQNWCVCKLEFAFQPAVSAALVTVIFAKEYGITADGELEGGLGDDSSPRVQKWARAPADSSLPQQGSRGRATVSALGGLAEDFGKQPITVPFKCMGTMLNCSSEDPCNQGSCTSTFHSCKWLGTGVFQQCGASAGACQSESRCYLECRGARLSGTACNQRVVKTGADCNNGFVKSGALGMACTVDPEDSTRCIEKHPCADDAELVIWAGMVLRRTPRCILERCGPSAARAGGVFVQNLLAGSPAESREMHPHCFLMEMNGVPVRALSRLGKE
ncbi:unnamed protein product, partial [Effrenium voratum]